MSRGLARVLAPAALLLLISGCSYETGAVFNADGTVTVSAAFYFPKSLMTGGAGSGGVTGMSPSDIKTANSKLSSQYPGAKVELVTKGEEEGAKITIPFKNEKDAFNYLTQPPKLNPNAASGSGSSGIDLSNTGGIFESATHSNNTYTFTTKPPPPATPDPQNPLSGADVLDSLFTVTFSLTLQAEITSAPGALFTADKKTAIWKVSLVTPVTLTATTGGASSVSGQVSPLLGVGVGLVAGGLGFVLGLLMPWRRGGSGPSAMASVPVYTTPAPAPASQYPGAPPLPPPGMPPPALPS